MNYEAFTEEVRAFARTACPPEVRDAVRANRKLTRKEFSVWQKVLHAQGWAAPGWPVDVGGTGWDMRQRYIFEEETAKADCPPQFHHGIGHIGPVLLHFGTPEQKHEFLPGILEGTDWWCQGYSEPGAGSDLASLKTKATLEGDVYVVSGQKIWTSHAHEADWMYTLVRTSTESRKQEGISLLLIPLNLPGIQVRPIHTIDAWHHVNEVFLDNVRVPAKYLVGEEGKGWRCAKYLLDRERLSPATVPRLARLLEQVGDLLQAERRADATRDLRGLTERLLFAQAEVGAAREMLLSAIDEEMRGTLRAAKSSALKLHTSELSQRIIEIALDITGPRRVPGFVPVDDPEGNEATGAEWVHNYLFFRSRTIAGGTSEVQKNVIARELFGA